VVVVVAVVVAAVVVVVEAVHSSHQTNRYICDVITYSVMSLLHVLAALSTSSRSR
jgi:hypothetical protein